MNNYNLYFAEAEPRAITHQLHGHQEDMTPSESVYWTNMNADIGQAAK